GRDHGELFADAAGGRGVGDGEAAGREAAGVVDGRRCAAEAATGRGEFPAGEPLRADGEHGGGDQRGGGGERRRGARDREAGGQRAGVCVGREDGVDGGGGGGRTVRRRSRTSAGLLESCTVDGREVCAQPVRGEAGRAVVPDWGPGEMA